MSYIVENKTERLSNLELVIMASSGTGASGLSARTDLLLRNPDELQKLIEEVRGAFDSDVAITMQSTSTQIYLTTCFDESMRLYPPAPSTLPRFVTPGSEFANDDGAALQPSSYGPRNCIAERADLAYAEMRMILADPILNFDVELAYPSEPWWEKQGTYIGWETLPLVVDLPPRQ